MVICAEHPRMIWEEAERCQWPGRLLNIEGRCGGRVCQVSGRCGLCGRERRA